MYAKTRDELWNGLMHKYLVENVRFLTVKCDTELHHLTSVSLEAEL